MNDEKPKGTFKQIIISILIFLVGGGGFIAYENDLILSGGRNSYTVLTGSAKATLINMPVSYVDENATTTDNYSTDNDGVDIGTASTTGGFINQLVDVGAFTDYTIFATIRGGTATSTFCIRPQWSFDGTNFYGINTTSTANIISTSTPPVAAQAICTDPGIATLDWTFSGEIPSGTSHARFQVMGDNLSTDPTDGIEGTITIGLEHRGSK